MAILHPTRRIRAIVPAYAQRFSCVGAECEDSCCSGWNVTLDKKTFNAYRQVKTPNLTELLDNKLKRIENQAADHLYATIQMEPATGHCPLWVDRLCAVQKELGEDKLSNVCSTYPRTSFGLGGVHQQSLTLSCPEAARMALLADDAMDFSEAEIHVRSETVYKVQPKLGLNFEQMNAIRFFCIQIVKGQGLLLWQKLAVLGLFCESLTEALHTGGHARLDQMMDSTRALIESGQVAQMLESCEPQHHIQAVTFTMLWQLKAGGFRSSNAKSVQNAMAQGMGADSVTGLVSETQLVQRYQQGLNLLPQALKDAPQLMENYVLNEIFHDCFPFAGENPLEQFFTLVTRFGLVRFMLAAQCQDDTRLPSTSEMARTVQVFARRYQHDLKFATDVNTSFKAAGWHQLDKVFRFLKP